ncbi:hypothetical protein L0Y59_02815 [Candidatus Uhrbacteria bacterium]|nr:hypothetical protein [Candidatus Uhrbacteria bacterium]
MQKIQTQGPNDTILTVETRYLMPNAVAEFITANDVTAQKIAKVEFDETTQAVGIGIVSNELDVGTKTRLGIGYQFKGYLTNLVQPIPGLMFVEATHGANRLKDFETMVKGLAGVKDAKTNLPATDLYLGTPPTRNLDQHIFFPNGKHVVMNVQNRKGIGNVRYVTTTKDLVGTIFDTKGVCQGIAVLPLEVVQKNPEIVLNPEAWNIVATIPQGRTFHSFGRPRTGKNKIQLIVNFLGGYERVFAFMKDRVNEISFTWGTEIKADRYVIGVVNGYDDLIATGLMNDQTVEILFETFTNTNLVGQTYLS